MSMFNPRVPPTPKSFLPKKKIRRGLKPYAEEDATFMASIEKRFKAGKITGGDIMKEIAARPPRGKGKIGTRPAPDRRPPPVGGPRPAPAPPFGGTLPAPGRTPPAPGGALGPYAKAIRKRRGGRPGDASTRPGELRERAARLRARSAVR